MIRVYWNKKEAVDGKVWSIDHGDISTEVNVKVVIIDCQMQSMEDLNAVGDSPKGWLQTVEPSARALTIIDDIARIGY